MCWCPLFMLFSIGALRLVYCDLFTLTCVFFFFKQKTAYEMRISDWSSDVCSSDLGEHNDIIYGDTTDSAESLGGDDLIYGDSGFDTIYGGAGDDEIYGDRKSVVQGKSVSVRVDLGGRRSIQKNIIVRSKKNN